MKGNHIPLVIGHRGAPSLAPENTMLSFQKAYQVGADMIELDLQETQDEQLVVIHDFELSRLASRNEYVEDLPYEELSQIDLGNGARIPLLHDVLKWAKGKLRVNVEIKVPDIEKKVLEVVRDNNMIESVVFSSFLQSAVKNMKKIESAATTALLLNEVDMSSIKVAKDLKADAVNPLFYAMPDDFIKAANKYSLRVYPWTVNDKEIISELAKKGVDGIITDFPQLAVSLLK